MGREFETLARDAAATNQTFAQFLLRLTELELASRAANAVATRIKNAGFPVEKDFDTYDFSAMPDLSKPKVLELARCEWIEQKFNCCLVGSHGTGKTSPSVIPLWSRRNARGKSPSPIPVIPSSARRSSSPGSPGSRDTSVTARSKSSPA